MKASTLNGHDPVVDASQVDPPVRPPVRPVTWPPRTVSVPTVPVCAHCLKAMAPADGLLLDRVGNQLWWRKQDVQLTACEYRVVEHLLANASRYVPYQELYDVIRGRPNFACGSTRGNVRSMIKRVRQKFKLVDPGFDAIRTSTKIGYRWEARHD
jgi:hypothetical protein